MLITALMMTAALAGGDPDGVVATAPATTVVLDATEGPTAPPVSGVAPSGLQTAPHGLTTDAQIEQWLAARAPAAEGEAESPVWRDDRKVHGEVSVGVGTHGYRDYGAAVSLPIGESGRLGLSLRKTENGYPYGYGYGRYGFDPYGYDPYFGRWADEEAGPLAADSRFARPPAARPLQADPE